jgi:hypothetical protein
LQSLVRAFIVAPSRHPTLGELLLHEGIERAAAHHPVAGGF